MKIVKLEEKLNPKDYPIGTFLEIKLKKPFTYSPLKDGTIVKVIGTPYENRYYFNEESSPYYRSNKKYAMVNSVKVETNQGQICIIYLETTKKTDKKFLTTPIKKKTMKMGIEFECVVYANSLNEILKLEKRTRDKGWDVATDCTIRAEQNLRNKQVECKTYELKTKPYTDLKKLLADTEYVFDTKHCSINEDVKGTQKIRVDFNSSTGTHIHFSSITTKYRNYADLEKAKRDLKNKYGADTNLSINTNTAATQELFFFKELQTVKNMRSYMIKGIKHEGVKKGFNRPYKASTRTCVSGRGAVNVGGNSKGTIEFRMCNLNGVKTDELFEVLTQQIKLVLNTINYGYTQSKKVMTKKAKEKLELAKQYKEEAEKEIKEIEKAHLELIKIFKKNGVNVNGKNDINLFQ